MASRRSGDRRPQQQRRQQQRANLSSRQRRIQTRLWTTSEWHHIRWSGAPTNFDSTPAAAAASPASLQFTLFAEWSHSTLVLSASGVWEVQQGSRNIRICEILTSNAPAEGEPWPAESQQCDISHMARGVPLTFILLTQCAHSDTQAGGTGFIDCPPVLSPALTVMLPHRCCSSRICRCLEWNSLHHQIA
jgi:hypothetical protein